MRYRVVINGMSHGPEFEILETCRAFHQICMDMDDLIRQVFYGRVKKNISIEQKDEYEWQSLSS